MDKKEAELEYNELERRLIRLWDEVDKLETGQFELSKIIQGQGE